MSSCDLSVSKKIEKNKITFTVSQMHPDSGTRERFGGLTNLVTTLWGSGSTKLLAEGVRTVCPVRNFYNFWC